MNIRRLPVSKMTPYQRIVHAGKLGTGVRLSAFEVAHMAYDTTIKDLAWNDDEAAGLHDAD